MKTAEHLSKKDIVNYGSFYTPDKLVKYIHKLISNNINTDILNDYVLLDNSCGTGNLLELMYSFKKVIGVDIDAAAIEFAKDRLSQKNISLYTFNSLEYVDRKQYNILDSDKLFIVGNPPYNDRTSIIQSDLKKYNIYKINPKVEHRDLGISFLLSYNELKADYVCVLHPLSYLIKKTNFNGLGQFKDNYILMDSIIISSQEFCPASCSFFPIIIALYKKDEKGMDYEYIRRYVFKTDDSHNFSMNNYDFINKYIDKYPNKNKINISNAVAKFYTMRDINALKRSRTFIQDDCLNTVYVTKNKYSLYCYVDVFKKYIDKLPYYFGNFDVFINYNNFKSIEQEFIDSSEKNIRNEKIDKYFSELFGYTLSPTPALKSPLPDKARFPRPVRRKPTRNGKNAQTLWRTPPPKCRFLCPPPQR